MAWTQFDSRTAATDRVRNIIGKLRTIHSMAVELNEDRALYIAGTDPVFNTIFDALINTAPDRTELASVINQLTALVITDWEANHSSLLGLP